MELRSFIQYLQFERRYSKLTIAAYESDIQQFASFLKKTYDLEDLAVTRATYVRSWLVSLLESGNGSRSINRKLSSLKSFFRFGLKNGDISHNPLLKVIAPKVAKPLPVFIQKNQLDLLWNHFDFGEGFKGARNRIIFELLYATGMRRAELLQLADASIDLPGSRLRVLGKGNKERMIPINQDLRKSLQDYIGIRNENFKTIHFQTLIVSDSGKPLNPRSLYTIVRKILEQVTTIEKKSPHVLRHTFATHLLNNGAEINAIKELLGHSSLAATQVYTHNTIDKLKDIYKKAHPKA